MIELHSIPASHGLLGYPIGQGQSAGTPDILQPAACLGRVLINAQMSGFGDEAEILCSTRALPVLTRTGPSHCASSARSR
jgi:hypothetical protein